ncbi:molybdate ABC transporter substrate-binding protein [Pseudothauera nasutitermitis]|uniref:Molybdate ABC transporter substrate-binding protein n=1 Tax=Pseudothauera nasutitermitis TaxID=2565930 RepID=A0A4S4AXP2_9RHOO|nr:molybdate ABC transporter substrate-binding protein [Pseudothauera nasutitermitis]THF64700.1 molybdate ABC transporter substrate-binding protein [Pseudothauera nasutitermitis]
MRVFSSRVLNAVRHHLLCCALLCAAGPALAQEALLVAAGAGYRRPVTELAQDFERRSGVKVEQLYGHMGQILGQVAQGGKVAVVFGDRAFLENAPNVQFARYLPAGAGRLVVAWPREKTLASVDDLAGAGVGRVALPDPVHAVYGKAAIQFLERSGLRARIGERLVPVSTVPQVSSYLVSGDVDAGFINLTDALGIAERIGGYLEIDQKLYDPVDIVIGVVGGQEHNAAVQALATYLGSSEARAILSRHGL